MSNAKIQMTTAVNVNDIKGKLYIPPPDSHKGQNGKLLLIGGSKLFHAASLWSLKIASRIVDMVYYASVPENNQIVQQAKEEFRDGIVIHRQQIADYIREADCILIGPGLPREEGLQPGDDNTRELTRSLLTTYKDKRWVIDGGSLQVMEPEWIPKDAILTPHLREFSTLFGEPQKSNGSNHRTIHTEKLSALVQGKAKTYGCTILLKGAVDIICSPPECRIVRGGNSGMTKGGTGDVLAGLVAALYCKNDAFLSAIAGSFINKKAGDRLFEKVGYYFNSSDLVDGIPKVMKELI